MNFEAKPFDLATIKPFYPALDESKLPNVGLRLDEGRRKVRRQSQRMTAKLLERTRSAAEQMGRLPAVDESLHLVLSGTFALADLIVATLKLSGKPLAELWIATLGFSARNVKMLTDLADAGQLQSVHMLCSHYFGAQDSEIYAHAAEVCAARGWRIASMRTHAKILLMRTGNHHIVIESSANLRSNANCEQATAFNDPGLFEFHRGWIHELLSKSDTA